MIIIEEVSNGYILFIYDPDDDSCPKLKHVAEEKETFSEKEYQKEQCLTFKRALHFLTEHIGPTWSDHNYYNLDIRVINEKTHQDVEDEEANE